MSGPKRTALQREVHLAVIQRQYLSGRTQAEIAQHLGISRQQVGVDLKTLQKLWKERYLTDEQC